MLYGRLRRLPARSPLLDDGVGFWGLGDQNVHQAYLLNRSPLQPPGNEPFKPPLMDEG